MKKTIFAILVVAAPLLAQLTVNQLPSREFGQPTLINPQPNTAAPNLVVGEELYNPTGIAFDSSVTPPRVYIVDTGNNRVLGWANANNVGQGNQADVVLGQPPSPSGGYDFTATLSWGPGTTNRAGLNSPTGIAVDASGNVYVIDSGNNRILRFVTPFAQQPGNVVVDLVIGQSSIASTTSNNNGAPNQGLSSPSQSSLSLETNNTILPSGLAIDGSGNLWVADTFNNRVLMFPAGNLSPNNQLPKATIALGQSSFNTNATPSSNFTQSNGGFLYFPTGVAVDSNGNVYVTDSIGRALVYPAPPTLGESGKNIMGIAPPLTAGQSIPSYPSNYTLGNINASGSITDAPRGIFVLNNPGASVQIFVTDSPQNRVVRYDSLTLPTNANSPLQGAVIGQSGFTTGQANQGGLPSSQSFSYPVAGAIRPDNNEMWVVDQGNNRVLGFTSQGGGVYNSASKVLGQKDFTHNGANLLEGREVWFGGAAGIVIDSTSCSAPGSANISCSGSPHLYVADSENNRILGFKDFRSVGVDARSLLSQTADIVIGQADLFSNVVNYSPANPAGGGLGAPTANGLDRPVGMVVDAKGNLWVADSGNGRVVRFPSPFSVPPGTPQTADMVLGQSSLTSFNPSVSQTLMVEPFGLAMFANGSLAVSDPLANRILVFNATGGNFTNGQAASVVVGQTGFSQSATGNSNSQLNSPRHIAVDSSDRLYVCDYNNNRLLVFSKPSANTPSAPINTAISQPLGIIVSLATGVAWITSGQNVYQLPEYNTLQATQAPTQNLQGLQAQNAVYYAPLAVALDPFDDVIVADNTNRVAFFYGQLYYRNTASFAAGVQSGAGPAPTMLIELARESAGNPYQGFQFQTSYTQPNIANLAPPWPPSLNGVQVTVNGIPAPIFRIDPTVIFVEVPNEAPSSGPADFVVSVPATGQILAAATFTMQQASPGIFTANSTGTGPVAANNYDVNGMALTGAAFLNSATNPVSAGGVLGLWLTGVGSLPGLPADGTPGSVGAPNPTVLLSTNGSAPLTVLGSAISSQYPGLWQVNVRIPTNTPPSSSLQTPIYIIVQLDGYTSNIGGNTQSYTNGAPGPDVSLLASNGLLTYIYVK